MHLDRILRDEKSEVVDFTDGLAGLDAATCKPHWEVLDMVIATREFLDLSHGSPAEFAAPDDERVIQQSALLEVSNERRRSPVHVERDFVELLCQVIFTVAVVIPTSVVKLDEPRPAFKQPTCDQAVVGKGGFTRRGSVRSQRGGALLGQVHQFGPAGLHTVRHFVGGDARCNFRVADFRETGKIEFANRVDPRRLALLRVPRQSRKVWNRIG